jgi:tetratricopeptide (TPR) repeat protein
MRRIVGPGGAVGPGGTATRSGGPVARVITVAALLMTALYLMMALCGGGPALAAAVRPDCAAGQAALRAGQPQRAEDLYATMRPRTETCVVLGHTAATSLLKAQRLLDMGLRGDADEMIKKALEAEPDLTVPENLRPNTVGQPGIKLAKTLDREGYHAAAVAVLQKVIENNPDIKLDSATEKILGKGGHPWHWYLSAPLTSPVTRAVAPWALFALVVGLVVYGNVRKRLYFQPFSGADEDTDRQAAALRVLIRTELHRLARESAELPDGRRLRLDQAGPYEDDVKLESVTDELPQGKLVGAALPLILRRIPARSRLVNGTLLSKPGVVLSIDRPSGKLEHTEAIHYAALDFPTTDQDPADDDELPGLALAGAVWIILSRYPHVRLGGTSRWDSYLAFAAGCAWQAKGDLDKARLLYARACDDPANKAAATNLAALDQLSDQAADPRDSSAYHQLTGLLNGSGPGDLHHYRARYLLSSILRDRVEESVEPPLGGPDLARQADGLAPQVPTPDVRLVPPELPASSPRTPPEVAVQLREEARQHAITLATELEEQRRNPAVPRQFVERNRAAALTLVARQVLPETTERANILSPAPYVPITEENLGARLTELATETLPGTAESLVDFVNDTCVLDEQAHFNLYSYYSTRAENLAAVIDDWQARAEQIWAAYDGRPPPGVAAWLEEVQVWQDTLEERYQEEQRRLRGHEEQITATNDSVLSLRLQATSRPYRPAPTRGRSHHRDYGTDAQRPPRDTPPPPEPTRWPDVPVPRQPEPTRHYEPTRGYKTTRRYKPADPFPEDGVVWVDDLLPVEPPSDDDR